MRCWPPKGLVQLGPEQDTGDKTPGQSEYGTQQIGAPGGHFQVLLNDLFIIHEPQHRRVDNLSE